MAKSTMDTNYNSASFISKIFHSDRLRHIRTIFVRSSNIIWRFIVILSLLMPSIGRPTSTALADPINNAVVQANNPPVQHAMRPRPTVDRPEPITASRPESYETPQPDQMYNSYLKSKIGQQFKQDLLANNSSDKSLYFIENTGQYNDQVKFQLNSGPLTFFFTEDGFWASIVEPEKNENTSPKNEGLPQNDKESATTAPTDQPTLSSDISITPTLITEETSIPATNNLQSNATVIRIPSGNGQSNQIQNELKIPPVEYQPSSTSNTKPKLNTTPRPLVVRPKLTSTVTPTPTGLTITKDPNQSDEGQANLRQKANIRFKFNDAKIKPKIEGISPLNLKMSFFTGQTSKDWRSGVTVYSGIRYVDLYPGIDLELTSPDGKWDWKLVVKDQKKFDDAMKQSLKKGIRLKIEGGKKLSLSGENLLVETGIADLKLPAIMLGNPAMVKSLSKNQSATLDGDELVIVPSTQVNVPTETPTTTEIPTLTATPIVTFTPEETNIPSSPTATIVPTENPTSDEPQPTSTFEPSQTQIPTIEPLPTATSIPETSATPAETLTPEPSPTIVDTLIAPGSYNNVKEVSWISPDHGKLQNNSQALPEGLPNNGNKGLVDIPSEKNESSELRVPVLSPDATFEDTVLYSTHLGDASPAIAIDNRGQIYFAVTVNNEDIPAVPGLFPFLKDSFGNLNLAIGKFGADGRSLEYFTYLGGIGNEFASDIGVDSAGSVYVVGTVDQRGHKPAGCNGGGAYFPTTMYAYDMFYDGDGTGNSYYSGCYYVPDGTDGFFLRLGPHGDTLDYSTYLGGSYNDWVNSIYVASPSEVYIIGTTASSDFPVTSGSFDTSFNGTVGQNTDVFVMKVNPNKSPDQFVSYSTYIGGSGDDNGVGIVVQNGEAYISGDTYSTNFPTRNAYDGTYNGNEDAFFGKLNNAGSNLSFLSYLGGAGSEGNGSTSMMDPRGKGIAIGLDGSIYLAGKTQSSDLPTYQAYDSSLSGPSDCYIARFASDGSTRIYMTYFGGSGGEGCNDITVDETGAAYVVGGGAGGSTDFPYTDDAFDKAPEDAFGGYSGGFLTRFDSTGTQLSYSTYIPGTEAWEVLLDPSWNVVLGGITNEADFPLTLDALDPNTDHINSGYLMKLMIGVFDSIISDAASNMSGCPECSSAVQKDDQGATTQLDDHGKSVINTRTGAMNYSANPDISLQTAQGELSFIRTYNTSIISQGNSMLGFGWTHNHDIRLIFPNDPGGEPGVVILKAQSANQYHFVDNGDDTFTSEPGILGKLDYHAGPPVTYTITEPNQRVYTFNQQGKLQTISDAQGFTWQYQYDGNGLLEQVTDVLSQHYLHFGYTSGKLTSVTDHTGRHTGYSYNGSGELTSYTDSTPINWSYVYDASHRLREVKDSNQVVISHTEYDTQGRAYQQFESDGTKVRDINYSTGSTSITDSFGNSSTHYYDTYRKTLLKQVDPAGNGTNSSYYYNFRPSSMVDGNNHSTETYWSLDGNNLLGIKSAVGNRVDLKYDGLNNLTDYIDERNYLTTYTYNTSDPDPKRRTLVLEVINSLGEHTNYTYTTSADAPQPGGLLKTVTDALSHTTTYTYNALGQRISSKDHMNRMTYYSYDNLGRLKSTTDTSGKANWTCYDVVDRVIRTVSNASGDGSTPQTDPCDSVNYVPSSDPGFDRITRTIYSAESVIATIDENGITTRTYYDENNRPTITVQNWVGQDLNSETPPAYDSEHPDQNIRTENRYDVEGRVIATIDPKGVINRTYYDSNGRAQFVVQNLVGQTIEAVTPPIYSSANPDQNIRTETVYDAAGNVIATKTANGTITRTYYNSDNRPTITIQNWVGNNLYSETPPGFNSSYPDRNVRTETIYDVAGNSIATKDANGIITRTYYDALSRPMITIQNWVGADLYSETPPAYDGINYPNQNLRTDYVYDSAGNQIAVIDSKNIVTRTYYDEINRPITVIKNWVGTNIRTDPIPTYNPALPDENVRTDTIYNSAGINIASKQWNQNSYFYSRTYYDNLNRPVAVVNNWVGPDIYSETIPSYNSANPDQNVKSQTIYDLTGKTIATVDNAGRITRTYFDEIDRPVMVVRNLIGQLPTNPNPPVYDSQHPDRNVRTETLYDADGSVIKTIDTDGKVTRNCYNNLKQMIKVVANPSVSDPCSTYTPSGETDQDIISWTFYDLAGNVQKKRDPNGKETTYQYDSLNRLTVETDADLKTTQSSYDPSRNRLTLTNAKGVITKYEFDPLNRLSAVVENYRPGITPNNDTNVRTEYTYDPAGNRLSIKDGRNNITSFEYDDLNRLTSETDPLSHRTISTYDAIGNRLQTTDAKNSTIIFHYDGLNRPTLIDYPSPDTDVSFTYDAAGNRSSLTDGTGTTSWNYDELYRPSSIVDPNTGTVLYEYDNSGNRKSVTYPDSKRVVYLYDDAGRLSTVTDWQSQTTTYAYDRSGQVSSVSRPNNVVTNYQYDNSGRLTNINHANANQTLSAFGYSYDEIGNRTSVTETMQQQTQPPTDLIFANAFESGDLSAWSSNVNDGGNLSVIAQASITGSYGMQAVINDNNPIYVVDTTPDALNHYRTRFYFDPNSISMGNGDSFEILRLLDSESNIVARVSFRFSSGDYQVLAEANSDGLTWSGGPWTTITDGPHDIEIDWQSASSVGANNGQFSYYLDNVQQVKTSSLDNDALNVDAVQLGAVSGIDSTTRGTLYFDLFESRGQNYIGLDTDAPAALGLPNKTDSLDSDGLETGDLSQWSQSVTDSGNLSVSTQAAMIGTKGLQTLINDTNSIYVTDWNPREETHYRARFYFNPNSVLFNATDEDFYIFTANNRDDVDVFRLEFSKGDGDYRLRVETSNNQATWTSSPSVSILDGPHAIEVEWKSSSLSHGYLNLWVDGSLSASITSLDNDSLRIDGVRLGVVSGIGSDVQGTLFFDGFQANRDSYIGVDPNGPQPPVKPDFIFADGFETGDLTKWTSSSFNPGALEVNSQAALLGTRGLKVAMDHNTTAYLVDRSPIADSHYRARFYFNPNSISMDNWNYVDLFRGFNPAGAKILNIEFSKNISNYTIKINDSATINLSNTVHAFELEWKTSSVIGARDGILRFWVDGILRVNQTNIEINPQNSIEYVYVGAICDNLAANFLGNYYLDAFESHRVTPIGLDPAITMPPIFGDGFEDGSVDSWSASVTDNGDLSAARTSSMLGAWVLKAIINDNASLYLVDQNPTNEKQYNARFYFDPNTIRMADGDTFSIFIAQNGSSSSILKLEFRSKAGDYQVRSSTILDNITWVDGPWYSITDGPHALEIDWHASSAVGANNGHLYLFVDAIKQNNLTSLDNDQQAVDTIELGAADGIDTTSRGVIYLDGFESRRDAAFASESGPTPPVRPAKGNPIFSDGFEGDTLSRWSSSTTDNGDLSTSATSTIGGTFGLNAYINDNNSIYVTDWSPFEETHYRARFYMNAFNLLMSQQDAFDIFVAHNREGLPVAKIELRYSSGDYMVRSSLVDDSGTWHPTAWIILPNAGTDRMANSHWVEIEWKASTAAGNNNGFLVMNVDSNWVVDPSWQNNTRVDSIDNDQQLIDMVDLGAVGGLDNGTRGTLAFDIFDSARNNSIGASSSGPQPATVIKADEVFTDRFESGNLSAWGNSVTDGGNLSVTAQAAIGGSEGLQAVIDDTNSIYVTDWNPWDERHYRARFYFDPNSLVMGSSDSHDIFVLYNRDDIAVGRLELRSELGDYQARIVVLDDLAGSHSSGWFYFTDAPHLFEIEWSCAWSESESDGSMHLWIDDQEKVNIDSIDNDTYRVEYANLGAVQGVDSGTHGTYYFDAFDSHRDTYIGPDLNISLPGSQDLIFANGFEGGNTSAWSLASTDGGDLSVTTQSAISGTYGLQAVIDDNNSIFVTDWSPYQERHYRARFYFDPNSITMATGDAHYIFIGKDRSGNVAFRVELRSQYGEYQLRAETMDDVGNPTISPWVAISDNPHPIELEWWCAWSPDISDGGLIFFVDDEQKAQLSDMNSDTLRIDTVELGAAEGLDDGTRGIYYFDSFESRHDSHIGLDSQAPLPISTGDSFESGGILTWTWSILDSGDLSVSTQAAILGSNGLLANINDNNVLSVSKEFSQSVSAYHARFYFDPNSISMGNQDVLSLFSGINSDRMFLIETRLTSGEYQVRAGSQDNYGTWIYAPWITITDGPHALEVEWAAATGSGAYDGRLIFWVDGVQKFSNTDIDNDNVSINRIEFGAYDIDDGTRGTLYLDGFVGTPEGYIGTDPNAPQPPAPPTKTDVLFADGFESSDFTAWSSSATDGGNLSVSTPSAIVGTKGMQALINDANPIYVSDLRPYDETRYRARFYFDPNTFAMNSGASVLIFDASNRDDDQQVYIEFGKDTGDYRVRAAVKTDSGSWSYTGWTYLLDGPHAFEVSWKAATAAGANNGELSFWIDGTQQGSLTTVDNDTRLIDQARLGILSQNGSGIGGTVYFDGFVSHRDTYMGLDAGALPAPVKAEPIFTDGFEAGNMNAWSSVTNDAGSHLSVTSAATILGTKGLNAYINDNSSIYVTDNTPLSETHYRARFYFDPNTVKMASGNAFNLFEARDRDGGAQVTVEFGFTSKDYQIRAGINNDAHTTTNTPWLYIVDGPHAIEVEWQDATGAGANNGSLTFWVDGVQQGSVTGVDNDSHKVDTASLGAVTGVDTGTRGTVYIDGFISQRDNYIGTDGSAPPAKPDGVFSDGLEGGNFNAWSTAVSSSNLTVTPGAALVGTKGMKVLITGTPSPSLYVEDWSPMEETHYRARFHFKTNGIVMAHNDAHYLLYAYNRAGTVVARVELRSSAGDYQVQAQAVDNSSTWSSASWTTITDGPHALEIEWQAATGSGANNGVLKFWIDGTQKIAFTNLNNDTRTVDYVQWGGVSGLDSTTSGSEYFDAFKSRRSSYIGPDASAPTPVPSPTKSDALFSDSFEAGNFNAWSTVTPNGSNLSVTTVAGLDGTKAMKVNIPSGTTTPLFVTDYKPWDETHYRVHFHINPNTLTMGSSDMMYIFYALDRNGTVVERIEFAKDTSGYKIRAGAINDASSWSTTNFYNITNAAHTIETEWQAATSNGANNGVLTLWIDGGTAKQSFTTIDNDTRVVDYAQFGGVSGIDSTTSGAFYLDGFASRRSTYIGMLPGITVAQAEPEEQDNGGGGGGRLAALMPVQKRTIKMMPEQDQTVAITISYVYDPLGRLKEANFSDGSYFHYTYDAVGNRLTETTQAGTINYVYDNANRLTSVGGVMYSWDNNGNLLSDGVNTYSYDSANRLKSVVGGGNTSSYTYNGLNNRVAQTVNSVITNYVLDQEAGLVQVLQDGIRSYLYGNERIAQETTTVAEYFLGDALGSVRQLTDANGAVVLGKSYEPYGDVLSSSGSGSSPFSFTGEMTDVSGLTYLRARYYASSIGRFTSRDEWAGDTASPISMNKWIYANGNPILHRDPLGLYPDDQYDGRGIPSSGVCYPLSGTDRMACEKIIRGISLEINVTLGELKLFDHTGDCDLARRLYPNNGNPPINVYLSGENGVSYGYWYHYLLQWTKGIWNNNGTRHVSVQQLMAFGLGVEFINTQIDSMGKTYMAEAFGRKGWGEGMYRVVGGRQSVQLRVNEGLFGDPKGGVYPNGQPGKLNENLGKFVNLSNIDYNKISNGDEVYNLVDKILYTEDWRSGKQGNTPYEWANVVDSNPDWFKTWINKSAPIDNRDTSVFYIYGRGMPGALYILTENQQNKLCGGSSCVKLTGATPPPNFVH